MSVVVILIILLATAYAGDRIIGHLICAEKSAVVMKKLKNEKHD